MRAPIEAPFPSDAWFVRLVERAEADQETLVRLGFADLRLGIEIATDDGATQLYGLVLDGYEIRSTGATSVAELAPEVVVSGPVSAWREMVAAIVAGGGADGPSTLNSLKLAGVPLEVRSDDAVGQDKFFRFMGTIQAVFDAAGRPLATMAA